jgi:3-oxoacyl-[acyl-carrier protein] reductase
MKALEGKNALITGATRGIGRGIALEFAKQGANVAFTHIVTPEIAKELEDELSAHGVKAVGYAVNATDAAATEAMVEDIVKTWGTLDIVINNAGITIDTLLLRMSYEQFSKVLDVNLNSVFHTTKAALKHMMLRQRSGCFVNISSVVGVTGNAGQANYAASKAGMIGFTKSVAKEGGARGVRANVVAPGFIATEMTENLPEAELKKWLESIPANRPGTIQDIADACVFLASDKASYITGQVLHVNGGMYM